MPIYQYACKNCDVQFEGEYHIDDRHIPTKVPCPNCCGEIYIEINRCGLAFNDLPHKKPPSWFNSRLRQIKKKMPGSKINIWE